MGRSPRFGPACSAFVFLFLLSKTAASFAGTKPETGSFISSGKPVDEFHCVPDGNGRHPAVVLLHGAGPRVPMNGAFAPICAELAEQGYYVSFIEYYSQTGQVGVGQPGEMAGDFPIWMAEIESGIEALKKNPKVDSSKIGMVGYSMGAFLSLAVGATDSGDIAAIVEYYGGLPASLDDRAAVMPPVLILHGDADKLVPVSAAKDLDALLTKYNRPHEMKIYPGGEHAFNFKFPGWYNEQYERNSWGLTVAFLKKYLEAAPLRSQSN